VALNQSSGRLYDRSPVREPTRHVLLLGRDEPPAARQPLRAGPLTAELDGVDLRYVRFGDVEIVRRLFAAIRNEAWGTVPPQLEGVEVDVGERDFHVSFEALHTAGELRFRWRGELTGTEDGTIQCRMTGTAERPFRFCRIGFCVLHPREHAGRQYRASTPEGPIEGVLPELIGMQRIEGGKLYPLFPSYDALEIDVAEGVTARFSFEGDLFEMEDQRNWTDASFKTYSTPITLGFPHDAAAGQEIAQAVRVSVGAPADDDAVQIELAQPTRSFLPPFGLELASDGVEPSDRELERLLALRPDHLRADLDLRAAWREELERAAAAALATGAGLELVVRLGGEPEAELEALATALPLAQARVARVLVLAEDEVVTDTRWVRLARERLAGAAPDARFAGGTDLWFTEVNRTRPELDGLDGIFYALAATVHADDDVSVMETPSAQRDTVRSARALAPGRDIFVGPVTIRPRSWPFGSLEGFGGLPFQVDPRQPALFGAAWTAASLKYLAEAEPAAITYFETTGWRGVMEREEGSSAPEVFRSRPGAVFPLYHVLADYGEWRGETVLVPSRSSRPLAVEALAAQTNAGPHALIANLTPEPQRCFLGPLGVSEVTLRVLDETTVEQAGEDPEAFRSQSQRRTVAEGRLELELAPYAVVRVDPAA
jgi:D-apionolactonase